MPEDDTKKLLDEIAARKEATSALNDYTEAQREASEVYQKTTKALKEEQEQVQKNIQELKNHLKYGKLTDEERAKLIKQLGEEETAYKKKTKAVEDATAKQKDYTDATKELNKWQDDVVEGMFSSIGLTSKLGKGFGNLSKSGHKFGTILKGIGPKLVAALPSAGLAAVLLLAERIFNATLELDSFSASLIRTTGMSQSMANEITRASGALLELGVSMEHGAAAGNALYSEMTSFKNQSVATRSEMITTVGMLDKMGVSAQESAGNIQFMTKTLGISANQATETVAEFANLATEIGMPVQEMSAQFRANSPILAKFGRQAPAVFKKLAVASRQAGMDVSSVLALAETFDTFEGAADSVGKLNAILGGPFLNSMDMVTTTDPTERMNLLSKAINSAGQSFDEMDYYTRKSIAAAAGLKDVGELALVMSGNWEDLQGPMNQSQDDIVELQKRQHEFNTTMEQFTLAAKQAIIPLAQAFLPAMQGLASMLQTMAPYLPMITKGVLVLGTALTGAWLGPLLGISGAIAGVVSGLTALGTLIFHSWASPSMVDAFGTIVPSATEQTAKGFVELEADTTAYTNSVDRLGKTKNKAGLSSPASGFAERKGATAASQPASASAGTSAVTRQPLIVKLEVDGREWARKTVEIVDNALDYKNTKVVV
tara:strand:+ start:158 stop:2128 length:1971 start_codon:yes stop_codon:yes gene_type:complete